MSAARSRVARSRVARSGRGEHDSELAELDASLLDIVDHVLTKGIVLTGDLVLGVADVDLVYLRLSAVLCAADRVMGTSATKPRAAALPRALAQKMGRPKLGPPR